MTCWKKNNLNECAYSSIPGECNESHSLSRKVPTLIGIGFYRQL